MNGLVDEETDILQLRKHMHEWLGAGTKDMTFLYFVGVACNDVSCMHIWPACCHSSLNPSMLAWHGTVHRMQHRAAPDNMPCKTRQIVTWPDMNLKRNKAMTQHHDTAQHSTAQHNISTTAHRTQQSKTCLVCPVCLAYVWSLPHHSKDC